MNTRTTSAPFLAVFAALFNLAAMAFKALLSACEPFLVVQRLLRRKTEAQVE